MTVPPNTMIGHYRVERPIGTGAFATVYRANDDRLDATVAVKMLAENRALDVDARRRFVEEAQTLRKVRSPAIIAVFDVGETAGGQPYMVLEYAARGDLANRFGTLGRAATADECRTVASFLHTALGALHRAGLVHRDVKPHNVLIDTEQAGPVEAAALVDTGERLVLGDLGFVKDLNLASGLTVGGGTWAYQAPEQRNRLGTVDRRADLYSASAVLTWLLSGRVPTDPQSWLDIVPGATADPRLIDGLSRSLAVAPEHRHDDIEAWFADIGAALSPPPAPAPPPNPPAPLPPVVSPAQVVPPPTDLSNAPTTVLPLAQVPAPSSSGGLSRGRRVLWGTVGGLVLAGAGFAGGVASARSGGADSATAVDGSEAVTSAEVDGHEVSISGPADIRVGRPVTFTARADPELSALWVYPDGRVSSSEQGVVYTAESPGEFTVTLLVVAPGRPAELIVHRVDAVP